VSPQTPQSRWGRSAQRAQTGRPSPSRPATGLTTAYLRLYTNPPEEIAAGWVENL
jgi:hypothetical protein